MSFIKKIFKSKKAPVIDSPKAFWEWFSLHESVFFNVVKNKKNIQEEFFNKLSQKLDELRPGLFFLCGMYDDTTAELIITPEGKIKMIGFVEEFIASAPKIKGWKFTALKPASDDSIAMQMGAHSFSTDNISFYANESTQYPDEIDITIVHDAMTDSNKDELTNGCFIFLDNYLGELNFATTIDNVDFCTKNEAKAELIPINKLKAFLAWREKEFIEKYEGKRYDTKSDTHSVMEATLTNGLPLVAVINTSLLKWDAKASHPWVAFIDIKYNGQDNNGMPNEETYQALDKIENELVEELKDNEGYLHVGRETADNIRTMFFACKEFKKPSKAIYALQKHYSTEFEIDHTIYKDKYWRSFNKYQPEL